MLSVLLLVSVTFFTLDYRMSDGSVFSDMRSTAGAALGPVQRAASSAISPITRTLTSLGSGGSADATRLRRDNSRLTQQLNAVQLDRSTVAQLRRLRLLAGVGRYRITPGRVIALGPSSGLEWTVTIDRGTHDGVRAGLTVINGEGLVGRVRRTNPYTAVVLLAVDPLSAVGSRLSGSGQLGLCEGAGLGAMRLQLLNPQARVVVGDRLVTGPYGVTTYAAGVPLGSVTSVTRSTGVLVRTAEVQPYVDFSALDVVGVVVGLPPTDPGDAALPPEPPPRHPTGRTVP